MRAAAADVLSSGRRRHPRSEKNVTKTEGMSEPAMYGGERIRPIRLDDFTSAHEQ